MTPAAKAGTTAVLGLNAAAIIWLYATFVPMSTHQELARRFEALQDRHAETRETVATLKAANEFLMNLERKKYQ